MEEKNLDAFSKAKNILEYKQHLINVFDEIQEAPYLGEDVANKISYVISNIFFTVVLLVSGILFWYKDNDYLGYSVIFYSLLSLIGIRFLTFFFSGVIESNHLIIPKPLVFGGLLSIYCYYHIKNSNIEELMIAIIFFSFRPVLKWIINLCEILIKRKKYILKDNNEKFLTYMDHIYLNKILLDEFNKNYIDFYQRRRSVWKKNDVHKKHNYYSRTYEKYLDNSNYMKLHKFLNLKCKGALAELQRNTIKISEGRMIQIKKLFMEGFEKKEDIYNKYLSKKNVNIVIFIMLEEIDLIEETEIYCVLKTPLEENFLEMLKSNVLKSFTEMGNGSYYEQNLLRAIEEEMSDINVGTIARRIALGETLEAMDREMDKEKIVRVKKKL